MSSWWHTPSGLIKESLWWWTLHWNRLNFLWISPTNIQETRSFYGFTSQSHAACGKFIHVCSTSLSGSWWVSRCCLGAQIVLKQTLMEKHEERMKCSEFARVITSKSFCMLAALGWNDKTQLPMPVVLARRILDQLQRLDVFCLRLAFGIVSLECANWWILPPNLPLAFFTKWPQAIEAIPSPWELWDPVWWPSSESQSQLRECFHIILFMSCPMSSQFARTGGCKRSCLSGGSNNCF